MNFLPKDLYCNDGFEKRIKTEEFVFNNLKKNGINISIYYNKGKRVYQAHINSCFTEQIRDGFTSTKMCPFEVTLIDLNKVERRSKKGLYEAIKEFNTFSKILVKNIKEKFNLNISEEEIIIKEI